MPSRGEPWPDDFRPMNASLIRQGAFLFLAFLTVSASGWQIKARSRLGLSGGHVSRTAPEPRTTGAVSWPNNDNGGIAKRFRLR